MANKKDAALAEREPSGFAIVDSPEAKDVMISAFDQLGVSNFQLSRLKIPAGGMTAWEVETLEGAQVHQSLDVIILAVKGRQKAWWSSTMDEGGGGAPPSCASTDGRTGNGINSIDAAAVSGQHKCAECAWDRFGSSRNGGSGKDCKDFSYLFAFQQGSRIPSLLIVPATSLKALQGYVLKLIDAGKRMETVVTRLGLKKAVSQSGITYSVLDLSWQADLDNDASQQMVSVSKEFLDRIEDYDAFTSSDDE